MRAVFLITSVVSNHLDLCGLSMAGTVPDVSSIRVNVAGSILSGCHQCAFYRQSSALCEMACAVFICSEKVLNDFPLMMEWCSAVEWLRTPSLCHLPMSHRSAQELSFSANIVASVIKCGSESIPQFSLVFLFPASPLYHPPSKSVHFSLLSWTGRRDKTGGEIQICIFFTWLTSLWMPQESDLFSRSIHLPSKTNLWPSSI